MKLHPLWISDNSTNLLQVRIREIAFPVKVELFIGFRHSAKSIEQVELQSRAAMQSEKFGEHPCRSALVNAAFPKVAAKMDRIKRQSIKDMKPFGADQGVLRGQNPIFREIPITIPWAEKWRVELAVRYGGGGGDTLDIKS